MFNASLFFVSFVWVFFFNFVCFFHSLLNSLHSQLSDVVFGPRIHLLIPQNPHRSLLLKQKTTKPFLLLNSYSHCLNNLAIIFSAVSSAVSTLCSFDCKTIVECAFQFNLVTQTIFNAFLFLNEKWRTGEQATSVAAFAVERKTKKKNYLLYQRENLELIYHSPRSGNLKEKKNIEII